MTGQTNEIQWYIARDGKQHGPLTDIEMRTFVAHSYLRTTDLIWRPGLPEWQPAPEVFAQAFQQPQAPQVAAAAAAAARAATRPTTGTPAQASASTTDFDQEAAPTTPSGRGQSFALGIRAAGPLMVALLLSNLVLGLISRTLPQINVIAVGFSVNALLAMGVLLLSLGAAAWTFQDPTLDVVQHLQQAVVGRKII